MGNFDIFQYIRRILRKTSTFIGCIDSRGWILILIAAVLAVCLGIYLYRRLVAKRPILPGTVQSALASAAEMLLIAAVVLGALLWPIKVHDPFGICGDLLTQTLGPPSDIAAGTFCASFVAIMGLILLSRLRISAATYLLAYTTMFILGAYALLRMTFLPAVDDILRMQNSSPFARDIMPQIMLPGAAMQVLRMFVWAVVPFLLGIYFVRKGFAWWKFIAGSLLGGWLVSLIVSPVLMTMNLWLVIQPVVFTLTGAILLSLPRQRAAFERLFGFPLRRVEERVMVPGRLATTIIGHLLMVIVLFVLAGLLVVGYVDRQQIRLLQVGPPQNSRYPSFVDAYPYIHPLFLKGYPPASGQLAAGRMPDTLTSVVLIAQGGFEDIRDEEGWARTNVPEMRKAFVELAPYFDAFTSSSRCDYVRLPEGSAYLGFLPIREISRAMHSRAMVYVRDGNTTDAVHDIETIIGFAGIMKDFPSMVAEMISVAVTGIATDAAHQYYKVLRHNPLAMDQLAGIFDRQRENLRVELNADAIRRGEPGMWTIATNAEIMMPAFLRADMNVRGRHMQIQMLEMAVALERFRNKHGHYPATQDELVPEFLRRVPLDPHRGKRYTYAVTGDDFTLEYSGPSLEPFEGPLEFPVPSLEEVKARYNNMLRSTRPPDRRTTTSITTTSNTAATSSPR